jgi:hypothetical protein
MSSLRSFTDPFNRQPFKLAEFGNDGVQFSADAIVSEAYSRSVSVSSYPVEKGVAISENAMANNFNISISGITSDASMSYFDTVDSLSGSLLGQLSGALTGGAVNLESKSQKAWNQLNKWVDNGQALQVNCKFAKDGFRAKDGSTIPWVINSLSVNRDKNTGSALSFNLTLQQIQLVSIGKATLITIGQIIDQGSKQLEDGAAPDAVEKQPPIGKLRDDKQAALTAKNKGTGAALTEFVLGGS